MPDSTDLFELYAWLIVAAPCAAIGLGGFFYYRRRGQSLLGALRMRAAPWSGLEVLIAFYLLYLFWSWICNSVLEGSGFLTWFYHAPAPEVTPTNHNDENVLRQLARRQLWGTALAVPFEIVSVLLLFRRLSGTLPYQFGLTWQRLRPNVVVACIAWLLLTPCVYAVEFATIWVYVREVQAPPPQHPIVEIAQKSGLLPQEWALATFITVLGAPVVEELLFRGVLQRWLCSRRGGPDIGMAIAMAVGLLNWALFEAGYGTLIFVAAMMPLYFFIEHLTWRWIPRPNIARGILATALVFAVAHQSVWMAVPLSVLGFGLGVLAYRTQSLIAPIVLHSLFNAVTMLALAFEVH